jgi:multidrug efflux pump
VGIALVLSAVLLPMAFFGGSTGVIYRQFSITIVSAMGLSVLVALIFTPALCATMLKPLKKGEHHVPSAASSAGSTATSTAAWRLRARRRHHPAQQGAVPAGLRADRGRHDLAVRPHPHRVPAREDQGVLFAQVQTPAGSSAERTQVVVDQMREYLLKEEADTVASVFTVNGFNFAGRGQSSGMAFIMLKPWDERSAENSVFKLAQRAQQHFFSFRDAMVFAFAPPAVLELGNATGFDVFLQDRAGVGHEKLMEARNQFLAWPRRARSSAPCARTA